jgi:hypothetical protein
VTYGRQGVAKPNTIKSHHAIIYTGSKEVQPQSSELPREGEWGMLKSIRVKPRLRSSKLDPMSRVNFAKIYTVEHNVKVMDFGDVHEDSIHVLNSQWVWALTQDTTGQISTPATTEVAELEQINEHPDESGGQGEFYDGDA